MKRIAFVFANPVARAIAAAAVLAATTGAGPARAASAEPAPAPAMLASTTAAPAAPVGKKVSAASANGKISEAESVETHITRLHSVLKITATQEDLWKNVAQVMRDNADQLTALAKARFENAQTMTAVDDLKSYAAITEAHEMGIEKLLPAFTTLYESLSDDQKKAADAEFRQQHDRAHHHHHHHSHPLS